MTVLHQYITPKGVTVAISCGYEKNRYGYLVTAVPHAKPSRFFPKDDETTYRHALQYMQQLSQED